LGKNRPLPLASGGQPPDFGFGNPRAPGFSNIFEKHLLHCDEN